MLGDLLHRLAVGELKQHAGQLGLRQAEGAQPVDDLRRAALQLRVDHRVHMAHAAEHALGIVEEMQFEISPDPQRLPAGDDDPVLAGNGALELDGHRRSRTADKFHRREVVSLDGLVGHHVDDRAGFDAVNLVMKLCVMRLQLRNGLDRHIVGQGQAKAGALVVGAQMHQLVAQLVVVHLAGAGQPDGEGEVGAPAGHGLPHRPRFTGNQFDRNAKALAHIGGDHIGGDIAARPRLHVAQADG